MNEINYKSVPFEYKVSSDDKTFEGYASTFGNKDLVGDIVQKGSFRKTLQERFTAGKIKILWQHDPYTPIGKPLHMEEDSKGLFVRGQLVDVEKGREALTLMKEKIIDSLSIGYDVIKDRLSEDGSSRFLDEIRLYEFSPVTFPANPEATISTVKSIHNLNNMLEGFNVEMLLKEGRVLSKSNRQKIQEAVKALQDVLKIDPSSEDSQKENELDPDLKEFSQIIQDMQHFTQQRKGVS